MFFRLKFHAEQGLLYEKSTFVGEKLDPRGFWGALIRLNIGTGVSIFGQNITIWHARPPKNYRFLVIPQQKKIKFFIVEL